MLKQGNKCQQHTIVNGQCQQEKLHSLIRAKKWAGQALPPIVRDLLPAARVLGALYGVLGALYGVVASMLKQGNKCQHE